MSQVSVLPDPKENAAQALDTADFEFFCPNIIWFAGNIIAQRQIYLGQGWCWSGAWLAANGQTLFWKCPARVKIFWPAGNWDTRPAAASVSCGFKLREI